MTSKNIKNNKINYLITVDGKKLYTKENSEIISNNFTDYFINITSDLLKQIKHSQKEKQENNNHVT